MATEANVDEPTTGSFGKFDAVVNPLPSPEQNTVVSTSATESFGKFDRAVNPVIDATPATNAALNDASVESFGKFDAVLGPVPETSQALNESAIDINKRLAEGQALIDSAQKNYPNQQGTPEQSKDWTITPGSIPDRIITWFGGGAEALHKAEQDLASGDIVKGERPPGAMVIAGAIGGNELKKLVEESTREPKPGEISFTNAGIPAVPPQEGTAAQIAAGVANVPIGFANFLLSPGGVTSIAGLGMLPKAAQVLAGFGFTGQQVREFFNAKTLQDKITSGVGAALLGWGTYHGTKGGEPNAVSQPSAREMGAQPGGNESLGGQIESGGVGQSQPGIEVAGARPENAPATPEVQAPLDISTTAAESVATALPAPKGGEQPLLTAASVDAGAAVPSPQALGAVAPGTGRTSLLIEAGRNMVRDIADTIGGKAVPRLTRAGVMDEAVQHASARQYVPALVQELQPKVFPTKYKSLDAMARTIDVIKADNILGGYDAARAELEQLRTADKPSAAAITAQEEFVKAIEDSQDLGALDAQVRAVKGTDIEADIHRWEQVVTPLMDQLYNEIKGADPHTPRETRGRHYAARMNLLPATEASLLADFADPNQPMPEISIANYRNPNVKRDRFMRQAKLTGEYSSDPNLVLLNSFAGRWNEVTKQRFYQALEKQGVAQISDPGGSLIKEISGKPAARMPIKMPETSPETGRTQMVERSLYVQKDLVNEIRNVLNTDGRLTQNKIFQALTQVQLLQLADATAHTKNIHSAVVHSLGNTTMGQDLVRKVPGLGTVSAIAEIHQVSREITQDAPTIRAEIAELTKRGMIRPEYPVTGVQKLTRMQKLIHDVDSASRVIMNRRFDNLIERGLAKDTPENRRNFVQQIGEYNRRLMSRQEAYLRDYGISPFIVAGRTFNRFSRRLVVGSPGFEAQNTRAAVAARAAQVGGLVLATTLPALVNIFTTGSMGGRQGTPVGAIDFGPNYDTEDGKHRVLDVFQLIGLRRGLRGTGIEAAMEGFRNGETWNTIAGNAAEGVISTSIHPFIGPGLGGVYQTLTGKRIDLRTGWAVEVPQARKYPGFSQLVENLRVALKTQNPFIYGIVQNGVETGMDKVFGIPPEPEAPTSLEQIGTGLGKAPLGAVGYKEMRPVEPLRSRTDSVGLFLSEKDLTIPQAGAASQVPDGEGGKRKLTKTELAQYRHESDAQLRDFVLDHMDDWRSMDKEEAQKELSSGAEKIRDRVKQEMFQ